MARLSAGSSSKNHFGGLLNKLVMECARLKWMVKKKGREH